MNARRIQKHCNVEYEVDSKSGVASQSKMRGILEVVAALVLAWVSPPIKGLLVAQSRVSLITLDSPLGPSYV